MLAEGAREAMERSQIRCPIPSRQPRPGPYDARVPNESEQERLTQLLSPTEAAEPRGEDQDDASLVRLITSEPEDQTVLSELIRRAVPTRSE